MITPEARVKNKIKVYLKSIPNCWFFLPVSNGMGSMGIPDIMCCIAGRMVAIECKAPGKEKNVTALQDRTLTAIREAGGVAFVASDVLTVILHLAKEGLIDVEGG